MARFHLNMVASVLMPQKYWIAMLVVAALTAFAQTPAERGAPVFLQQCAFCHGRDAGGGEEGPDLTRSKLVADDKDGDKIAPVIREGRPEKGMPRFTLPDNEITALVAFIHDQKKKAEALNGKRRGVEVADLQTGNAQAGKAYFAAHCASCHSATGDLADIAKRFEGLKLMQRFLYPRDAKATAKVTTSSGEIVTGQVVYHDEFTIGLRDAQGRYRSWDVKNVKFEISAPVEAHAELLSKYTDDDIHNLMAYLQTLH